MTKPTAEILDAEARFRGDRWLLRAPRLGARMSVIAPFLAGMMVGALDGMTRAYYNDLRRCARAFANGGMNVAVS